MATYKVSSDGKTVSVSGKTYTLTAFKKQFKTEPGVPLNAGAKGYAAPNPNAKAPVKINTNPSKLGIVGKTIIGPLARGGGILGVAGAALGAKAAYEQEAKRISNLKKKSNRMN